MFGPKVIEAAGAALAKPPANATPALPLDAYAGTYGNAYVGEAVVSEEGGALTLALGPDGAKRFPLSHFDRDTFVFRDGGGIPRPDVAGGVRDRSGRQGGGAHHRGLRGRWRGGALPRQAE